MTACLSADLYALRVVLANAREVTSDGSPVRLVVGWNQSAEWVAALDAACDQLDQVEDAEDLETAPRRFRHDMSREEWLDLIHDERGRRRTVRDVAEDLGCNPMTVRKWLRRHNIPNLGELLQLGSGQGENNGNDVGSEPAGGRLAAVGDGGDGGCLRAVAGGG